MKIEDVRTFLVDAGRTSWVFVKLYTNTGLEGVGEATLEWRESTLIECIRETGRFLIGQDPFRTEWLIETLNRDSYWRTGAVFRSALSALEAALLDIKKALNVPVYELLGGKQRDTLTCYGNGWFAGARTPEDYAAKARAAVQLGFKALKWDPFGHAYLDMDRAQRRQTIAIVEAVRDAVGPDIDLMIEVHGRLNVPTAIAIARELEDSRRAGWRSRCRRKASTPWRRSGPRVPSRSRPESGILSPSASWRLINKRAVDVLQPDVGHVGGMLEAKKIAGLAHMRYLPVAPHNPTGPVMNAMTIHLAASIPNFHILETIAVDVPWRKEIVREDLEFSAGEIIVPTKPGLEVELDEEACKRRPHKLTTFHFSTAALMSRRTATIGRSCAPRSEVEPRRGAKGIDPTQSPSRPSGSDFAGEPRPQSGRDEIERHAHPERRWP